MTLGVAIAALTAAAQSASGALPGENGLVAFSSTRDGGPDQLYAMRPDGGAQARLVATPTAENAPAWSPDGSRLAFARTVPGETGADIWVMDADGTGATRLTTGAADDTRPTWSPDGARIAFQSDEGRASQYYDIHSMSADGSGRVPLTSNGAGLLSDTAPSWSAGGRIAFSRVDYGAPGEGRIHVMNGDGAALGDLTTPTTGVEPDWSPDGTRIAFMDRPAPGEDYDVYVVNADGGGRQRLTTDPGRDHGPAWSPDGTRIVFGSSRADDDEIYVMGADGSGQTRLTTAPGFDHQPAWQPLAQPLPPAPPPPPAAPPPPPTPPFGSVFPGRAVRELRPAIVPARTIDAQINDVEVTQGVQPVRDHVPVDRPGEPRGRAYSRFQADSRTGEVTLIAGNRTVVRVYANLRTGPAGGIAAPAATLEAWRGATRLGQIGPEAAPAVLAPGSAHVQTATRLQPRDGVYTFRLPLEWTIQDGTVNLIARVNPAGLGCDEACRARSTFFLSGVPFLRDAAGVIVRPVPLTVNGFVPRLGNVGDPVTRRPLIPNPQGLFDSTIATTPRSIGVTGWAAPLEIGDLVSASQISTRSCFILCVSKTVRKTDGAPWRDMLQGQLMARLERHARGVRTARNDLPIGLIQDTDQPLPGAMRNKLPQGTAFGYAVVTRPYTAIAHEVQHALGRPHASPACDAPGNQAIDPWPPDQVGQMQGIGLDTRLNSGGRFGPYRTVFPFARDLMSYCAREPTAWVSPFGWQSIVAFSQLRLPFERRRGDAHASMQASPAALFVTAIELPDESLSMTGTAPVAGADPPGDPASPHVIEARDAAGATLASLRVTAEPVSDGDGSLISGAVATPPGTDHVVVRRGGEAAVDARRSPGAPRVTLVAPRPRVTVAGRQATVRWRAVDPDGDALTASVEFSANGGRTWRTVFTGPSTGRAAIPRSALAGSRNARLRVRVDDGFNRADATSGRLVVRTPAPVVRIQSPSPGAGPASDAPLALEGTASGAGGGLLPSRAMRWYDGARLLGRGRSLTVSGLAPGRHRLQLVATQAGATGRASVVVRVPAARPAFLRLDAPAAIARRAGALRLRVEANVAAVLRTTGSGLRDPRRVHRADTRTRTVTIPVRPGTRTLRITLTLAAGGRATRQQIIVARR
ncbi:MAG: hypothetical protein AB7V42_05980 [Thermoleophilia bacterium]